jgi:dienelactone hydrolase
VSYLRWRRNLDRSRLAYVGFSCGGAIAFQVAFLDRRAPRPLFSLVVNYSGSSNREQEPMMRESTR